MESTKRTLQNGEHVLSTVSISKEKKIGREALLFPGHVPWQIPTQRSPERQKAIFRELPPNMEDLVPDRKNMVT